MLEIGCIYGCLWGGNIMIDAIAEEPGIRERVSQAAVRTFKGLLVGGCIYGIGSYFQSLVGLPDGPSQALATGTQIVGSLMPVIAAADNITSFAAGAAIIAVGTALGSPLAGFFGGAMAAYSVVEYQSRQRAQQAAVVQQPAPQIPANAVAVQPPATPTVNSAASSAVELQTPSNRDVESEPLIDRKMEEV